VPDDLAGQYARLEALLAEIHEKYARLQHCTLPQDYVYPPEVEEDMRILREVIAEASALRDRANAMPI